MKRTTIMVPDEVYEALQRLAEERGQKLSEVVREALGEYAERGGAPKRRFTFIGAGASVDPDASLREEEILGELMDQDEEFRW